MRLDPKYFNTFLAVVAVVAALFIAYFTVSSQLDKRSEFKERIVQQDSLQTVTWPLVESSESISIADFSDRFVLLHFWSNWSERSVEAHRQLAKLKREYGGRLTVIAAAVGLRREEALSYASEHGFPFYHVAGSRLFSAFQIPGVPAYLLYAPEGRLEFVLTGSMDEVQFDSLRTIMDGKPK
ncbi:Thiol-disulfide isomerase or thioredoxin [Fodinibius roseus]|uniref:Thiol-disulfide isomerase or thioredoxin n=1 Tax=Fodinibius roseus TaxID=1194090 RepID=A0A1M4TLM4_9BACT|nr:TlpA disulfide reductase family protein [Fodinibius roseus]SHE45264.1 Thiol-disulfide isomerase or thioredoxin [Fodinibius roseus]